MSCDLPSADPARPEQRPGARPTALDPDSARDPLSLAEYVPGASVALTEAERRPTLSAAGRIRLDALLADPAAPAWTHTAGDRLTAEGVRRAAVLLPTEGWLEQHLAVARELPAYRGHPGPLRELADFPLIDREDLLADPGGFVPRDADLRQLIHGSSSGSTGHALLIPDHLEDVARTFTLVRSLIADEGVTWEPDPARMALAYLVHQRQAFTYASTISTFAEATMARLNVDDRVWPAAGQTAFLTKHQPQVYTGDPAALARLLEPDLVGKLHPLAIISGATALTSALRIDLASAYGCPVLDVYGLHETRPIAVSADGGPHVVLDRRVLVEVFGPDGQPVEPGERGELVVTAGENPLLPLVRYRTGDFGRLVSAPGRRRSGTLVAGRTAIADLEGRASVVFRTGSGARVPSVDLTQLLQASGAYGWRVVQDADGRIDVIVVRGDAARVEAALQRLLDQPIAVSAVDELRDLGPGKPRRYERLT